MTDLQYLSDYGSREWEHDPSINLPAELERLRRQFGGRTYAELVKHKSKRLKISKIDEAARGIAWELEISANELEDWNKEIKGAFIFGYDCGDVFARICDRGEAWLHRAHGRVATSEDLLNLFEWITLRFTRSYVESRADGQYLSYFQVDMHCPTWIDRLMGKTRKRP